MRIFVASDLHADFKENRLLLEGLDKVRYRDDALIVAGDVAHRLQTIRDTLSLLRSRFRHVFYTPGNHELWVRGEGCDSIEKLHRILEMCEALDVQTRPARAGRYQIIPLFSWYDDSLNGDGPAETGGLQGWRDFRFCRWPAGLDDVCEYLAGLNRAKIKSYADPVISFSHFLPRRDLLPARARLRFKALPRVAGSLSLERQIRELGSTIHVFGHSHINCDLTIEGIRYVQNAFLYPKERVALRSAGWQFWKSDDPLLHLVTA
jgi:Icc-related predicted phosphoesterase